MLTIRVRPDRISLDDLIELQDGNRGAKFIRQLLAKVLVDEAGEYLPDADALQVVGRLSITEVRSAIEQFRQALAAAMEQTIPPTSGGS